MVSFSILILLEKTWTACFVYRKVRICISWFFLFDFLPQNCVLLSFWFFLIKFNGWYSRWDIFCILILKEKSRGQRIARRTEQRFLAVSCLLFCSRFMFHCFYHFTFDERQRRNIFLIFCFEMAGEVHEKRVLLQEMNK